MVNVNFGGIEPRSIDLGSPCISTPNQRLWRETYSSQNPSSVKYRNWVGYALITGANTPDEKIKLSLEINNIKQEQARAALDYCQQFIQKIERKIEQLQTSFISH